MKRARIFIAAILILSLLTMGCNLFSSLAKKGKDAAMTKVVSETESIEEEAEPAEEAEPVEKEEPAEAEEPEPTATPEPAEEEPPTPTAEAEGPVAEFDTEAYSRLHTLNSYRYELAMEAIEEGKTVSMTGHGAFVREPPAAEFYFEMKEGDEEPDLIQYIRVANKVYLYDAEEGGWMVIDADSPMADSMDMLGMIMGEMTEPLEEEAFKLVDRHQKVNGVDCSHYRADAKDLPEEYYGPDGGKVTNGQVDVWMANGAGHLMRFVTEMKGEDKDGNPMEATFTLEIMDVNESIQIEPPPEDQIVEDWTSLGEEEGVETEEEEEPSAPSGSGGITQSLPRPGDAADLSGMDLATAQAFAEGADFSFYRTGLSVQDAAQFFEEAWGREGWEMEVGTEPSDDMAFLFFTKGDTTVDLILYRVTEEEGCLVILYVE